MAKKFEKKLLSSAMAVALAAGLGYAGSASAIHLAEDGKGQMLMSAIYMADYGYNTKVAITNTRTDVAVQVRIALRSRIYSDEFDFVCLMTPSDVCRFEIVRDAATGQAYLSSTDDSILADEASPIFASQCATQAGQYCQNGKLWVKAYDWNIRTTATGAPIDWNEIGHMEVMGTWAAKGRIFYSDTQSIVIAEGMSKADLYKIMGPKAPPRISNAAAGIRGLDSFPNNDGSQNELLTFSDGRVVGGVCTAIPDIGDSSDVGDSDITGTYHGAPCNVATGALPASKIRSTDPSWIQLTGQIELDNGVDRMGARMTALDGDIWDNLTQVTHIPAYGMYSYSVSPTTPFPYAFDGRVVSNPMFQITYGAEVRIGEQFGYSRAGVGATTADGVYDNIVEIENALATQQLQGAYENYEGNYTNLIITFPTKYRHDSSNNFYREGIKEAAGYTGPVGPQSLGDINDNVDVCASELTLGGGHATGDARLYDGRVFYPPFRSEGSISYNLTVWNDQEVRDTQVSTAPIFSPGRPDTYQTITDEVNYHWVSWPIRAGFNTGWFSLTLQPTTGCQYKGAPVLAYAHKMQWEGGTAPFRNSWLVPLATENDARYADTVDTATTELTN